MSQEALLKRADRHLESAALLLDDGDSASSISRSYYAMFYAAQASLRASGTDPASHRGVISPFGEQYVNDGPIEAEFGRHLSEAFRQRNLSGYEPTGKTPEGLHCRACFA
jgi:uncharacterized protein (UPF0332 family)